MPDSAPFVFEELAGCIHGFMLDIFATDGGTFGRIAKAQGLTREQAAALSVGSVIQEYAEIRSATAREAASFILDPDWRYVREKMSDLLTEMYVTDTAQYQKVAAEKNMPLDELAAVILVTALKQYLRSGQKDPIHVGIPAKHIDQDVGL